MRLWPFGKKRSDDDDGLSPTDPRSDFWYQAFGLSRKPGGQAVNATTSSRVAAVFACHTAIKESVAMLPTMVIEQADEGTSRVQRKDHYVYKLMHDQPNEMMDSFEFFECMQQQALDDGNAFAYLSRKKSGAITRIMPLDSSRVQIKINSDNQLVYLYTEPGTNKQIPYYSDEIFHFKPHTKDGLTGRTVITVAADTIGFSLAVQEHGNRLFENGAFQSGFVQSPVAFKDNEARETFLSSFRKAIKKYPVNLLEQGVTFQPSQMNNKDAQFLEVKEFNVVDIARLYRMPPVMIQAMDKGMAFASVEQLAIMFVQYTIGPWVTRWERAIKRQLLNQRGDENLQLKFNMAALQRGDLKSRTEALVQQLQYGLLTINEGRALEDRNPIDDEIGDEALLSHNLIPASKAAEANIQPQNQPQKAPEPTKEPAKTEPTPAKTKASGRFQPLFQDILGRIKRRELQGAKKAPSGAEFETWAKRQYDEIRGVLKDSLAPACTAKRTDFEPKLELFLAEYLASRSQMCAKNESEPLGEAIGSESINWAVRLDELLEEVVV